MPTRRGLLFTVVAERMLEKEKCRLYCVLCNKYRILHGKRVRTVFTHELWRIRNRTSERSERVRFLIQNNECVNTVQSTFHVVLCLLYTY